MKSTPVRLGATLLLVASQIAGAQTVKTNGQFGSDVAELFRKYLATKNGEYSAINGAASTLWMSDEQKRWPMYEMASFYLPIGAKLDGWDVDTVPGSAQVEYRIRARFRDDTPASLTSRVTMTLYATREDGRWKLANALPRHTRNWTRTKVGPITYVFPPGYKYDIMRASRAVKFTDSLSTEFGVKRLEPIDVYLGHTLDQVYEILGLEYGNKFGAVGGLAQPVNRQLFSGIPRVGEDYRHELAHLVLAPLHTDRTSYFVSEGVATWLGGTTGLDYRGAVSGLAFDLRAKPNITLDAIMANPHTYGARVSYPAAAVLVAMVYDAGGTPAVKELFSRGGTSGAETHATVQRLLGGRAWAGIESEWRRRIFSR